MAAEEWDRLDGAPSATSNVTSIIFLSIQKQVAVFGCPVRADSIVDFRGRVDLQAQALVAQNVKELAAPSASRQRPQFEHVRAHRGDIMNERDKALD